MSFILEELQERERLHTNNKYTFYCFKDLNGSAVPIVYSTYEYEGKELYGIVLAEESSEFTNPKSEIKQFVIPNYVLGKKREYIKTATVRELIKHLHNHSLVKQYYPKGTTGLILIDRHGNREFIHFR